jgi:hypothetical protein
MYSSLLEAHLARGLEHDRRSLLPHACCQVLETRDVHRQVVVAVVLAHDLPGVHLVAGLDEEHAAVGQASTGVGW